MGRYSTTFDFSLSACEDRPCPLVRTDRASFEPTSPSAVCDDRSCLLVRTGHDSSGTSPFSIGYEDQSCPFGRTGHASVVSAPSSTESDDRQCPLGRTGRAHSVSISSFFFIKSSLSLLDISFTTANSLVKGKELPISVCTLVGGNAVALESLCHS